MSTDKGVKLDEGKPRMDLVLGDFDKALWEVGRVGTYGAEIYTDKGWQTVDNAMERYLSAMIRHYLKYRGGDFLDNESMLPHLAHMAWNALAVLQLYCRPPVRKQQVYGIPEDKPVYAYNPIKEDKPRGL